MTEIRLEIDDELLQRLEAVASEKGMRSRDELIVKVLADSIRAAANENRRKSKGRMGKADEKLVEDRLKALGYM